MSVIPLRMVESKPVPEPVRALNEYAAKVLLPARKYYAAIVATKRAIHVTPNSRELWSNLGSYYWNLQAYDEAEAALRRALQIDLNYAVAHNNLALVLASQGRFEEAEQSFTRALAIDPDYLGCRWDRSLFWLALGRYEQGFKEYETRIPFRKEEGRRVYPEFAAPVWQGESLAGKSVYIASEQGLGDTILFSRFLPWVASEAAKVYVCCSDQMISLLWEFRHIVELLPEGVPVPETDFSCVMGSLPHRYDVTAETIPADPGLIRKRVEIQQEIGPIELPQPDGPSPLRIGLCWTGNPAQDRNGERSVPLEDLMQLAAHPQIWAYSLQVGSGESDLERICAGSIVHNLGPQLRNRGLAAAGTAMLGMDVVITCCTAIAHLAGALGVPCWVMLCNDPYWLWMHERDDSPWYPSLTLFRQEKPGDWKPVVARIYERLEIMLERRMLRRG